MSEPPTSTLRSLQVRESRMWRGELEFTCSTPDEPVATLLITQVGADDVLRVDWNGVPLARMSRALFYAWLRTGELEPGDCLPTFVAGQVVWSWRGMDRHLVVTISGIELLYPATARYDLRTLAVR